jgi:hypothetical protein
MSVHDRHQATAQGGQIAAGADHRESARMEQRAEIPPAE